MMTVSAQPSLNTDRLLLRPFSLEDANEVMNLAGNENVARQTTHIPHPYRPGVAEQWIGLHHATWNSQCGIQLAIVAAKSEQLVGAIELRKRNEGEAEIGYWVGEPYWGRGYCTEATIELIEFGFAVMSVDKIIARHLTSNPASGEVMRKAGMKHIATITGPGRYGKDVTFELFEIFNTSSIQSIL